jgi:hypothetical protein
MNKNLHGIAQRRLVTSFERLRVVLYCHLKFVVAICDGVISRS